MRICFIGALDVIHLQRLMKCMEKKGHEIHIITYSTHANFNIDNANIKVHKIDPVYNFFSRYLPKKSNYAKLFYIRKIVKTINPDIVHGHFLTDYGLYTVLSGSKRKIIHLTGSDIYINWKKSKLQKLFDQYALKKSDIIISPSNHTTTKLIDYFNVDRKKIVIFSEGINPEKFNPNVKPCFVDNENYIVISTRRLYPLYNVKLLIESIPYVIEKIKNVKFVIIGDGPEKTNLENLALKLGVKDNILFIGKVNHNEIPKWLMSSDIYVSTSLSDSLGLSNLEAMACGVFPIVTDVPVVREYIIDGESGYIVPFDKPDILAEKIVASLMNSNIVENAKDKNYNVINSRAIYNINVRVIEETYNHLTKERMC